MATTIANLAVQLSANTASFKKGMDTARAKVQRFERSMKKFQGTIGRLGFGILAGLGIGKVVGSIKRLGVEVNTLTSLSSKLGISTQAFQKLAGAGELVGITARQLELGMQRMTRRISEAAKDTGEAQAAIKELGFDADKLKKMKPDQQFLAIADAMARVSLQSDRVRLSFKLFDAEGVNLLNILQLGREELEKLGRMFERFGLILSREGVNKLQKMDREFKVLGMAMKGSFQQAVVDLSDEISGLVEDLRELLGAIKEVKDQAKPFSDAYKSITGYLRVEAFKDQDREFSHRLRMMNAGYGTQMFGRPGLWNTPGVGTMSDIAPNMDETAENTKKTTRQLDELISLTRQNPTVSI